MSAAAEPVAAPRRGGFLRRLFRTKSAMAAAAFVALLILVALLAPWIAGPDPLAGGMDSLVPPLTPGHPLGTDDLGRDIWTGIAHGGRVSLAVGLATAVIAVAVGTLVGALAGFYGGWVDTVLMRIAEFFQTLPRFVVALIVIALFGPGVVKVVLVIAALSWPQTARLVRAAFASLREQPFVDAARVGGMGSASLMVREILPNAAAPIIVTGSLDVAAAILLEAGLGFFGLGDPDHVSWGGMLNEAQQYLREAWWMSVFPGLAIALTVLSFNVLGDALNDALNPRARERR